MGRWNEGKGGEEACENDRTEGKEELEKWRERTIGERREENRVWREGTKEEKVKGREKGIE